MTCRHMHLSGRPCEGVPRPGYRYCDYHASMGGSKAGMLCDACRSMVSTFKPRAGWNAQMHTRRPS